MLRFLPVLLALAMAWIWWQGSSWHTRRTLLRKSTPLSDPVLSAHVACMAETLGTGPVEVRVYDHSAINGLASPDGRVYVTSGLIRRYREGEIASAEVASVIAHEIGHLALGHAPRRRLDFLGQNAVRLILGLVIGRFIPFIGPIIATRAAALLASLLAARLSRRDEFEADAYGAALMHRIGLGHAPQVALLRKLDESTGRRGPGVVAWLASHPPVPDRVAAIEALARDWPAPRSTG
ncbi:peptidase M48 [Paroceanicella profunda]|uniref:Peptidase M48 n=1 Tax=Paroceanicella profunda TaxID=2579971 RepID=A0A5B8FI16_9RHOB|nr:M48 family metallopeptidase [Paroceanicella profunda]QDL92578.1 peptidase M48 [Paroceanicella profunda]